MTDDILARAEQAMDGTSEGPWHVDHPTGFPSVWRGEPHRDAALVCPSSMPGAEGEANAAFIAAARTLVPELVAALREARNRAGMHEAEAGILRTQRDEARKIAGDQTVAAITATEQRDQARAAIARVREAAAGLTRDEAAATAAAESVDYCNGWDAACTWILFRMGGEA